MKMNAGNPILNALTVDVEDYFHVWAFRNSVAFESWDRIPSRVERNTRRALEILAEFDLHATFFVLGWVAERYPSLVREIQQGGHEIGCHSYAHRLVYEMTPAEFRADTQRALSAIEDAAGVAVHAYRAPSFSITRRSIWALEILAELGFTHDCSIFPVWNPLYGIPGAPRRPFDIRVNGSTLMEFPLPAVGSGKWAIPITGGAYLRLIPYRFQVFGLKMLARRGSPFVVYFHPWELDPQQPRIAGSLGSGFYHYAGLNRTESRLRRLFREFAFGKLSELVPPGTRIYELTPRTESKDRGADLTPMAQS